VQAAPHGQDAFAHRGDVGSQDRRSARVGQHAADEAGGVDAGAGVVAPHGGLELAEHAIGFGGWPHTTLSAPARSP
jgi:hypothetical protein